jgi:dTDP-glucose 4,6-dehydratase
LRSKFNGIVKYEQLITHVEDRHEHDVRYAIDASKMVNELNWVPSETFTTGIKKTIELYLKNKIWCNQVKKCTYLGQRL